MDQVTLTDLIETCKASAILSALEPTEASIYRNFCRRYSILFHTPLHLVETFTPEHVLLNIYEHQMDEMDIEENMENLHDMILQIEDPNYDAKAEEELMEFAALAEEEEKSRIASGSRIGQKPKPPAKEEEIPPDLPKEGALNLAYLQDSEHER